MVALRCETATSKRGHDKTRRGEGQQRTMRAMPAWASDLALRLGATREGQQADDEGQTRTAMEVLPSPGIVRPYAQAPQCRPVERRKIKMG